MGKSWFFVAGGLMALLLCVPDIGLTQPSPDELHKLLQEIEALKAGQKAISNDLQEIKKLLSSRAPDRSPIRDVNVTLNVADGFTKGDQKAPLTLVEFTDYQ
jgi:hypothetical protein